MNKITITGRATADFEEKTTTSGIAVCSFSLAVKRPHTKDTTDFINCTAWRQGANYLSTYAKKGDMIGVTGTLTSRNFEDKSGNKRTAWEVVVDDVEILSPKNKDQNNTGADSVGSVPTATNSDFFADVADADAELPF